MSKYVFIINILIWFCGLAYGQKAAPNLPQRTVTISVVKNLDYGQILLPNNSSGGQVSISYAGIRQITGDLVAYPGDSYDQALLSFRLCPGRSINIQYSSSINLTDNASHNLSMTIDRIRIGNTLILASGQSFMSNKGCNDLHYMELGTTLNVAGSYLTNPPGSYNGNFTITVAYE